MLGQMVKWNIHVICALFHWWVTQMCICKMYSDIGFGSIHESLSRFISCTELQVNDCRNLTCSNMQSLACFKKQCYNLCFNCIFLSNEVIQEWEFWTIRSRKSPLNADLISNDLFFVCKVLTYLLDSFMKQFIANCKLKFICISI